MPQVAARASDDLTRAPAGARPERSRWWRRWVAVAVLAVFVVELALGWRALVSALGEVRAPNPAWLLVAVAAELAAMGAYARMQRRLLHSTGLRVPLRRQLALAYAAHSLSITLPGGPVFSTRFNYRQMRRLGASAAVASWCIALSGVLSAAGLAVLGAVGILVAGGTPQWRSLLWLVAMVVLATVGVRWLARSPGRLQPLLRAVLKWINGLRRRPAADGLEQVRTFLTQLRAARMTPGHAAAAAGYAVLNWFLDATGLWVCLHAVAGHRVSAAHVLLVFCGGMAAGTLTIVPGGLGIVDNVLVFGLIAGGLDASGAIAAVVLYRIVSFGLISGAGWLMWLVIQRRGHRRADPALRSDQPEQT